MSAQIRPAFMDSPQWKAARSRKGNATRWHGRDSDEYRRTVAEINAASAVEYARAIAATEPPLDNATVREVMRILRAGLKGRGAA